MKMLELAASKVIQAVVYPLALLVPLAFFSLAVLAPQLTVDIKPDAIKPCMGGFAFCVTVPSESWPFDLPADNSPAGPSRLQLFENGVPLGPAHSLHEDIASKGSGRYSHWANYVVFSTHDNGDPRVNGRHYSFSDKASVRPSVWTPAVVVVAVLFTIALVHLTTWVWLRAVFPVPITPSRRHLGGWLVLAFTVAVAASGVGAFAAQSSGLLKLDWLGNTLAAGECGLAGLLAGVGLVLVLSDPRLGKLSLSNLRELLLPASLLLIWTGALLYYVDSPSQSYLRMSAIDYYQLYDVNDYLKSFGEPSARATRSAGQIGLPAPWWIARMRDGDTITLHDTQLGPDALDKALAAHPIFLEVFGREHAFLQAGRLSLAGNSASLPSAAGAEWIRLPLNSGAIADNGVFSITYHAARTGDFFDLWGTLADTRNTMPIRPRLIDRNGAELPLVFGPSPLRGGTVTEANLRTVANLNDVPGADAVWRLGWDTGYPNTKLPGLLMALLGGLGIGIFVLLKLWELPYRRWQLAVFLGIGCCASIYFLNACVRNGELLLDNYLSSSQAQQLLALHGDQRKQFIAEHFRAPSENFVLDPDAGALVPDRTLGDHGVMTDDLGYATQGWRIFNNEHSLNLSSPPGLATFISMVAQFTGLSLVWNSFAQALLYAASGAILGLAALRLGLPPLIGLAVWLLWLFDVEGSKYTQITYTEALTFPLAALVIFIIADTLAAKDDLRNKLMVNAIVLACALAIAIYIRDIYIVLAVPIVGFFLLVRWTGLMDTVLRGILISVLVIASWIPVTLLHNGRSLADGVISLTPMELDHVQDSNFGANPELWAGNAQEQSLPLRWLHNSEYFWQREWIYYSGLPFEGQLFGSIAYAVTATLPYLVVLSGLAIFLLPMEGPLYRFIVASFFFLAFVTIFHAVTIPYISGRNRAPYEPLQPLLAGIGLMFIIRGSVYLRRIFSAPR